MRSIRTRSCSLWLAAALVACGGDDGPAAEGGSTTDNGPATSTEGTDDDAGTEGGSAGTQGGSATEGLDTGSSDGDSGDTETEIPTEPFSFPPSEPM